MGSSLFMDLFNRTRQNLAGLYAAIKKKPLTVGDFDRDIISIVGGVDNKEIHDPYEIAIQFYPEEEVRKGREHVAKIPLSTILVSSAYLLRAVQAYEKDRELGWSYMADARYWCGVARQIEGIEKAYKETVASTKRDTASKGAKARVEKYASLKVFAQELARSSRPDNGGWKSRNHAVRSIKKRVLSESEERGVSLSADQADVTLNNWLSEMQDAENFFSKKK